MSGAQTSWDSPEWREFCKRAAEREPKPGDIVWCEPGDVGWRDIASRHLRDEERRKKITALADRLISPNADKVYIAKEYTKADLRRDLLASIS